MLKNPCCLLLHWVTRKCSHFSLKTRGDHNIAENINKLIKNLTSFTWFVFGLIIFFFFYAMLSCPELACARGDLNYANFSVIVIIYQQGRQLFHEAIWTTYAKSLWPLFFFAFLQPKSKQRKVDNVRIRWPVKILRRNNFQTEFELFFCSSPSGCFRHTSRTCGESHFLRVIKSESATLPTPLRIVCTNTRGFRSRPTLLTSKYVLYMTEERQVSRNFQNAAFWKLLSWSRDSEQLLAMVLVPLYLKLH